jgi:hypothetical protein
MRATMTMFVVRNTGREPAGLVVKLRRRTPALASPGSATEDLTDWFCLGEPEAARQSGHSVVMLHDGWYPDDQGGGVVIYGPFWEIRDTPFTVREAAPDPAPARPPGDGERDLVDVRKAIFGA